LDSAASGHHTAFDIKIKPSVSCALLHVLLSTSTEAAALASSAYLERLYGECDIFIAHVGIASSVALLSMRNLRRFGHLAVAAVAVT
jgi:hypothetical protein